MSRQHPLHNSGQQPSHTRQMPAGALCSFPTLAPLWMPPGVILVWNLIACGSPRPEICLSSHPLHFLWNPKIFREQLFPAFVCICTLSYVPGQANTQFLCAALTMKDIPVLHQPDWEGTAHTGWREERNWGVCSRRMASLWLLLLRSDTAAWGKSGLPKVLGVILGLSWRGILAQRRGSGKEAPANTLSMHWMCGVWALPLEHASSNSNLFFKMLSFYVVK